VNALFNVKDIVGTEVGSKNYGNFHTRQRKDYRLINDINDI